MLLDFFASKIGIFGLGQTFFRESAEKFRPPLEKILATPQLMRVIVSFTFFPKMKSCIFLYIPETFKDNTE